MSPPSALSTPPNEAEDASKKKAEYKPHGKDHLTPLQAISQGVQLPGIPTFTDVEKHRAWILEHMALAFRALARKGYDEGMSGHISIRDPANPHTFWTNPLGIHFSLLTPAHMLLVDYTGTPLAGATHLPANAAGFLIHAALHRAHPHVAAAVHMHSRYGKAWSAFARPLEMLNQDVCYFYGDAQAVYAEHGGVVFSEEEGERLAAALGPRGRGMVLRNHGLVTVGGTVDEAAFLFSLMERSCEVQLAVEAAAANGVEKVYVPEEAAEYTYRMGSSAETLYWEFQPDLQVEERIVRREGWD